MAGCAIRADRAPAVVLSRAVAWAGCAPDRPARRGHTGGVPSQTDPAYGDPATRRRILDAALSLLEERGTGVRLADIAARANVSRQSVYLHFGDRARLMLALVADIDDRHGASATRANILDAPTGAEALIRWVQVVARYSPTIDRVTEVLELGKGSDPALAAAWNDRMQRRRHMALAIVTRLSDDGVLRPEWSVAEAAETAYVLMMPGPWRELTRVLGWSTSQYESAMIRVLATTLVVPSDPLRADPGSLDSVSSGPHSDSTLW